MHNLKEAFGAKVKELRRMRGLTQEELAEMIDVNTRQLCRLELGENLPSADTLANLAISLDVRLADLFDFEWNHEATLLANGTYGVPVIRLVQKNEKVHVKLPAYDKNQDIEMPKQIDVSLTESVMINTAKRMKKPLTVEYFNDKTRKYIKTYYPDGTTAVNISEQNVQSEDIQNYIKDKLKKYSLEMEKLEFVKLAVDSIENVAAMEDLKNFIKGLSLVKR